MYVIVVGLSHKTAPIEIREKVAFPIKEQPAALAKLLSDDHIAEAVILSTCNRTEIYAVANNPEKGKKSLVRFLCDHHSIPERKLSKHLYFYDLEKAIHHLFRVASSLDSMIVGEAQILGQVKEAYTCAFEAEATSIIFNKLFTAALRTGKRVRSETAIGESATSVSSAAVELAERVFEDLQGRTVMILGAGKMSELTAQALKTSGVASVIVSNRTYERAVELARAFKGRAVKFDEFTKHMVETDIVISSTGAPHFILKKEDMVRVMRERRHTPIFLIDIAVPRDIEPKVGDLYNVFLYDIDNLQSVVSSNLAERAKEAEIGEAIIDEEVEGFNAWISSLEVTPTITDLKAKAEAIRSTETEKILKRLSNLSDKERNEISALTKLIMAKLLHEPIVNLKEHQDEKDKYLYVESIRRLFGLEEKGQRTKSVGRKEKERE